MPFHFNTKGNNDAVPVIPVDDLIHTDEHPFCGDPSCPCGEDQEAIGKVNQQYQDGLYTAPEATRRVRGWFL